MASRQEDTVNSQYASLSSWLCAIKSDDIDDGLAADFDGSLSGLGVELGNSTFNMSEALLALPVYKQENLDQGFQYILSAATSPATKIYEETVTYLNQGQSYEIKVKARGGGQLKGRKYRTVVRVIFHERRLQYNEKEQLNFWMQMRPGERIVDVDVPLCYGVLEVKVSKSKLNCIELIWDPEVDTGVFIKIHAISTEFTPRKHGGEKGVPFRIQLETYLHSGILPGGLGEDARLLHGASCQVKVFKPKGADRKHKTDREKIEKRSEAEKEKYQPSYDCTVLTEIPLEKIKSYLSLLDEQESQPMSQAVSSDPQEQAKSPSPVPAKKSPSPAHALTTNITANVVSSIASTVPQPTAQTSPSANVFCIKDLATFLDQSSYETVASTSQEISPVVDDDSALNSSVSVEPLSPSASAQEVTGWLKRNRFSNFTQVFQNFAGADLLRLSREDLTQICGLADGIRLDNALQSRQVRPKLTIYVCQARRPMVKSSSRTRVDAMEEPPDKSSLSSSPSTPHDPSPQFSCPSPVIMATVPTATLATSTSPSQTAAISNPGKSAKHKTQSDTQSNKTGSEEVKSHPSGKAGHSSERRKSGSSSQVKVESDTTVMPPPEGLPPRVVATAQNAVKVEGTSKSSESGSTSQEAIGTELKRIGSGGGGQGWKRQYRDEVDSDDEVNYSKKLRTRTLELSTKGVYHAVYLEFLTFNHLREKMSSLFSISPHQILQIHVQGPSGIHVLVTDNVVQNFPDQTRYHIETYEDDIMLGFYKILLHTLETS